MLRRAGFLMILLTVPVLAANDQTAFTYPDEIPWGASPKFKNSEKTVVKDKAVYTKEQVMLNEPCEIQYAFLKGLLNEVTFSFRNEEANRHDKAFNLFSTIVTKLDARMGRPDFVRYPKEANGYEIGEATWNNTKYHISLQWQEWTGRLNLVYQTKKK